MCVDRYIDMYTGIYMDMCMTAARPCLNRGANMSVCMDIGMNMRMHI